jgi:hypothetical protein
MADLAHEANYRVTWVAGELTITNPAAPTTTILNAGVALEGRLTPTGLARDSATDRKDTTKLNSTFGTQSVGRRNFTLSVTAVRDSVDTGGVEAALTYKALGWLVIRDNIVATTAWTAAQTCEVYPVQVDNPNKAAPAVNEDQTMMFGFALRNQPTLNAIVA